MISIFSYCESAVKIKFVGSKIADPIAIMTGKYRVQSEDLIDWEAENTANTLRKSSSVCHGKPGTHRPIYLTYGAKKASINGKKISLLITCFFLV